MSLFTELRHRNVFKVSVAYAIVAWLLIQIASILFATFHAPDWVMQVFTVILILGFPVAVVLAWAYELTPEGIRPSTSMQPGEQLVRKTGHRLNYIILGLVVFAVGFLLVDNYVLVDRLHITTSSVSGMTPVVNTETKSPAASESQPAQNAPSSPELVRRYSINLGDTQPMAGSQLSAVIALSRDGRQLVYSILEDGTRRLYDRGLDQLTARELPGAGANTYSLSLSPVGDWLAFSPDSGLGLHKVSTLGGPPQELITSMDFARGSFWAKDGMIYFSQGEKLQRIPATGGTPEPVKIKSEFSTWTQGWPYMLPDGKHMLLTAYRGTAVEGQTILLSLKTGETRVLIRNGYNARYVPTGHIVFMRSESLWAVPFDPAQLQTTGAEVPVVNGIQTERLYGTAIYAFSDEGLLVYLPGRLNQSENQQIYSSVWVDRDGKETPLDGIEQTPSNVRISPDGKQLVLGLVTNDLNNLDVWTYELGRGTLSRRTFTGDSFFSIWSPDGKYLVHGFWSDPKGIARVRADGTGQPEMLIDAPRILLPNSFSPDGSQLVYNETITGPTDIYVMSMTDDRTEKPLLATKFNEAGAAISPDGKWMAYQSDETGRLEIYVRPFPDVDSGKWQISTNGGQEAVWRGDGKELYYRVAKSGIEAAIMAVPIETEPVFRAGTPTELFSGPYGFPAFPNYDVTTDGQRFIMLKLVGGAGSGTAQQTSLVAVDNWFAELKRLAPPAK